MGKNVLKEDSAARGQYVVSKTHFLSVAIKVVFFFLKNPNPKSTPHVAHTSISSAERV